MASRRKLVVLLGLGMVVTTPLVSFAQRQTGRMVRVGVLQPNTASFGAMFVAELRAGLRELGWVEGRNIAFEVRYADAKYERLPKLAAELVRSNVDVIVTGATPGALAAKQATAKIPIVAVSTGDFVASGLVASLAKPGGNLTGVTALGRELTVKRLALLKETVPGISRVAVLANPDNPEFAPMMKELAAASRKLGVHLQFLGVRTPNEFEQAFAATSENRLEAMLLLTDLIFATHGKAIVEFAKKRHLPTIYPFRELVGIGGLMYYGAPLTHMYRHAAVYVDKVLKGVRPADLPVEQPTKFDLAINMKTAEALRVSIPPSVMIQATRLIR